MSASIIAATCARCGDRVVEEPTEGGFSLVVSVDSGYTVCLDFHGHDKFGLYAPSHVLDLDTDDDPTVVQDSDCPNFQKELDAAGGIVPA